MLMLPPTPVSVLFSISAGTIAETKMPTLTPLTALFSINIDPKYRTHQTLQSLVLGSTVTLIPVPA